MAYENLCMYCFKDSGGDSVCPHCGKDARAAVPQIQLLPGTTVYRGRFLVGRALGQDTNGIVYTALDTKRGGTIRVREYLPRNCADRLNDGGVVPIPGMEDAFDSGMKKLKASVESVDDPSKRHFYFEENGTAYIAQRKGSGPAAPAYGDDDGDDYEYEGPGRSIALYIAIAAAVVVLVAIGIIWFLSSMDDPDDITLNNPLPTMNTTQATWKPAETPSPTPYVAPTFAALVDPELSWMEYTYPGNVNSEYDQQVQAQPARTPKPTSAPQQSQQYTTINKNSSAKEIASLQTLLAQYGWMDVADVNGKYDSNTVQAVKDFQAYVNENLNPSRRLTVDGIAGNNTLKWLLDSDPIIKPTPTPEPLVTIAPDGLTVNKNSSRSEIRAVQNKLIVLSLLPEGSADGIYGNTTTQAVINFQVRVNQLQGYNALEITGTVDPLTMAYLNYYVEWWQEKQAQQATPAPTSEPTIAPADDTINASSSRADVAALQELLAGVGLLTERQIDGAYGLATAEAVATFQQWVNELRREHTLNVTGEADILTRRYLEYCIENNMRVVEKEPDPTDVPVQIPTPTPTAAPDPDENNVVIDADSPKESIRYVQEMLAGIGLLKESGIDGAYGRGTKSAVSQLQAYVNAKKGYEVLEVNGICDSLTLQYLEYCYDEGIDVAGEIAAANATPTPDPTREPTPEPTKEPTPEPTVEPEYDENTVTVNPDSPKESIMYVQEMLAGIGMLDPDGVDGDYGRGTVSAVKAFQQFVNDYKGKQLVDVTGICDALTLQYLEYCYDEEWDVGGMLNPTQAPTREPEIEPTPTPDSAGRVVNADSPVEEVAYVQQMLEGVGLIEEDDIDGDYGKTTASAVKLFQQFVNWKEGRQVLELSGECDADTMRYLEYCFDNNWDVAGMIAGATATEKPEPTPTPNVPTVGKVSGFKVRVDGERIDGGGVILDAGVHQISWSSESGVESYFVYLYDEDKELIKSAENTSLTGFELDTRSMNPGELYTLYVGALPVNGAEEDISWISFQLMHEAEATPEPTPAPTKKPSVGKPAINIGSSVYQDDGVTYIKGNSVIFNWMAEGPVESYTVYLLYEDMTQYSLGETQATSKTVSGPQLKPGLYKLYVGAKPEGGSDDDIVWNNLLFGVPSDTPETPAPTQKPTQAPENLPPLTYIDSDSRPEDILRMQTYLYAYGLIPLDTEEGVLDKNTIIAVITFQLKVNEVLGANIIDIIDPTADGFRAEDFIIDEITLTYLQDPTILGLSSEDFIVG